MNKLIVGLSIFLLLMAGVVFYELNQAAKSLKPNAKVTIGKQVFDVEVAKTDQDKQIGLTKYSSLKENQGMLFPFEKPELVSFWMKNMKFPIDIIFINQNNQVDSFVQKAPPADPKTEPVVYNSESPVTYVLEISADLVKKYNIQKGDAVKVEIK